MQGNMTSPRHSKGPDDSKHLLPHGWAEWYRFAAEELGYEHDERVEYANLRYVEEQNRTTIRRARASS